MAFCTITDIEEFLQIEIPSGKQVGAHRAIERVTEAIKNYCRQEIEQVEDDEITLDIRAGQRKIFLPELPVTEVSEVMEDGETLTEGSDEDYQLGQNGVLYRLDQNWTPGIQIVTVTYTHGYATIPDDVQEVAIRAAARRYQAGLRAEEVEGVPGVQATSLGDYSVTYGSEQSTGAGEAVLGASAAPILLRSEKEQLNRYRL